MSGLDQLKLPDFRSTEDALAFGRSMTRDQFILLTGARQALQGRFAKEPNEQERLFIAVDIQLCREALEAAPDLVHASMLPSSDSRFSNHDLTEAKP